jgi:3-deoxy-D-manno-octulosonic-acid transferase
VLELARRVSLEDGHSVLLSAPAPASDVFGRLSADPPVESPAAARAFLAHWRPDLILMTEGELRPILLHEAALRGIPMILADGSAPYLAGNRRGLWPGLYRECLDHFRQILAVDEVAARALRKRGADVSRLRVEGRMEVGSSALPCNEAERAALVRQFQTRPVWLAASVPEVEDAAVIAAHRSALRLAHRLLLILVPDQPERGEALARHMHDTEGWTVARRSADEEPDEETEVFLADAPAEMGLWYRLAPITFLGGTLAGAGSERDPNEAAALGSAMLHGPRHGTWSDTFQRLAESRATRPVSSPADLAEGLAELLSPDRVARLAQAAWAVSSSGADVTDRVVLLVRDLLDGPA